MSFPDIVTDPSWVERQIDSAPEPTPEQAARVARALVGAR